MWISFQEVVLAHIFQERVDIEPFWIVDAGGDITDPHNFHATFREEPRSVTANVARATKGYSSQPDTRW